MKFGRKIDRRHMEQLGLIKESHKTVPKCMGTGGWAVEAIHQTYTDMRSLLRSHENVDLMVEAKYTPKINYVLDELEMERYQELGGNIHAKREDGLKADVVILYSETKNKKKFWVYKTPYHNERFRIPTALLQTVDVKVEDVKFRALNPTALYVAKILPKEMVDTDTFDAAVLGPHVDPKLLKKMMPYTKI
jgi:hypothetical protein